MYMHGAPVPSTEGDFTLRIEATPPPSNDNFAGAAVLQGTASEEPNGRRPYFASAMGHTWGAGKEVGEPDHGGDQGGGSVWYSWTAPESGSARISVCCFGPKLLSVYTGGSLAELSPIEPAGAPLFAYPVIAGATYRIAVDGAYDEGAGASQMGPFRLFVFMDLTPGPGGGQPGGAILPPASSALPAADTTKPQTKLGKRRIKPARGKATFRFSSNEAGSRFRCKLDRKPFRACRSPRTYSKLSAGRHVFRVVAIDAAGNVDRSAAVARFRIKRSAVG
jgi:hypothetical protein